MRKARSGRVYLWQGLTKEGARATGRLIGSDKTAIILELRKQGLQPLKIISEPIWLRLHTPRIRQSDISLLCRNLTTLMTAGIPLVQAIDIIRRDHNKLRVRELLQTIHAQISAGQSFSETLEKYPRYFNKLFITLVKSGEQIGKLGATLSRVADYMEKKEQLKKRIAKALAYPTLMATVSCAVAVLLLIWILPQFETIFQTFGSNLPFLTKSVLVLARIFYRYAYIFIIVISAGMLSLAYCYQKSKKVRRIACLFSLRVPLFNSLITKTIISRIAETLTMMLSAGISLVDALKTVSQLTNNIIYHEALINVHTSIAAGQELNFAMKTTRVFPDMIVQMIAVAEETGNLEAVFKHIANSYEADVKNKIDLLSSMIEPVMIILMASIIGLFVLAMYLPIFSLGAIIK